MRWTLANQLTLARIALVPLMVAAFYLPVWGGKLAAALFVLAAITDGLDGWLARVRNETTSFGSFLDPVADKLLVATALVLLTAHGQVHELAAAVIIGREIAISALREWLAGQRTRLAVSWLGKLKTVAQMVAIPMVFWQEPVAGIAVGWWGNLLLWLAAVLT
ncbi:MAG: CDP-diacylglycerol--glycerol-3-phosphate 3-phosphatidyltransferase, partial [Zetaproteobacteria bacterium]